MELQEEVKKRKKDKWLEVWFAIEALSIEKEKTESALATHIEKLKNTRDTLVFETTFKEITKAENPIKNVKEAYSQIVDVKLMVKNIYTLFILTMLYGPSSIEILSPEKIELNLDELQDTANLIAGVIHQFASAGVGGIVITPDKK